MVNRLNNRQQPLRKQLGVGLIEILVTVVLLSMGFLAAARMQVEGMRFSQSAYYQSQAFFLANDMINRMRTNNRGVEAGDYDNISTSASASDPKCSTNFCSPSQIALQDIYEWSSYFHPQDTTGTFIPALPSTASIPASASVTPFDEDIYAVQLVWSEIIEGADTMQSLTLNFALEKNDI